MLNNEASNEISAQYIVQAPAPFTVRACHCPSRCLVADIRTRQVSRLRICDKWSGSRTIHDCLITRAQLPTYSRPPALPRRIFSSVRPDNTAMFTRTGSRVQEQSTHVSEGKGRESFPPLKTFACTSYQPQNHTPAAVAAHQHIDVNCGRR